MKLLCDQERLTILGPSVRSGPISIPLILLTAAKAMNLERRGSSGGIETALVYYSG